MTPSPIQNRIGSVFIPVGDMQRSLKWYCQILGMKPVNDSHSGKICTLRMENGMNLILDSHKKVKNSSQPICSFWTEDIFAAKQFLAKNSVHPVNDIEDIGSVTTLTFQDPDGNLLMVCQKNNPLISTKAP